MPRLLLGSNTEKSFPQSRLGGFRAPLLSLGDSQAPPHHAVLTRDLYPGGDTASVLTPARPQRRFLKSLKINNQLKRHFHRWYVMASILLLHGRDASTDLTAEKFAPRLVMHGSAKALTEDGKAWSRYAVRDCHTDGHEPAILTLRIHQAILQRKLVKEGNHV